MRRDEKCGFKQVVRFVDLPFGNWGCAEKIADGGPMDGWINWWKGGSNVVATRGRG